LYCTKHANVQKTLRRNANTTDRRLTHDERVRAMAVA